MISYGDLCVYEEWFTSSYPCLPLDASGEPDINFVFDTTDLFFPLTLDNLFILDVKSLENNFAPYLLNHNINSFYIDDVCKMLQDIMQCYYKDMPIDGNFITSSLGRGIFDPFFIINTMLEHIVLLNREMFNSGFYFDIKSILELDSFIYYKLCISMICSLRTSLNKEYNVLYHNISNGKFTSFKLSQCLDLFPQDSSLFHYLAEVYNLLSHQMMQFNPHEPYSLRVENIPDVYGLKRRVPIYNIVVARNP